VLIFATRSAAAYDARCPQPFSPALFIDSQIEHLSSRQSAVSLNPYRGAEVGEWSHPARADSRGGRAFLVMCRGGRTMILRSRQYADDMVIIRRYGNDMSLDRVDHPYSVWI
jgi:hypothetical protein